MDTATYGENFVVSGLNEDNVCIGDRLSNRLNHFRSISSHVNLVSVYQKIRKTKRRAILVYQTGLSGWYVRIIETGDN
ncbi:MOSC domain-containing protein [Haemophilus influenzae biotype aegyptius]|nr:MOSC domain-containing protein [Haemophilus influenzae biotype aegyptius]